MHILVPVLVFAYSRIASAWNWAFVVPPDIAENVPNYDLTYAFGDYMTAEWWCNWDTITLQLRLCGGADYWNITQNAPNENKYTFQLGPDLVSNCADYSFYVWEVVDQGGGTRWSIGSKDFRILNQTDPPVTKGTLTETLKVTLSDGTKTTFTTTAVATASNRPVFGGATVLSSDTVSLVKPTNASFSATSTSTSLATNESNSNLSSGGKIGLGIGVGLGVPILISIAVAAWLVLRRSRSQHEPPTNADTYGTAVGYPYRSPTVKHKSHTYGFAEQNLASTHHELSNRKELPELPEN